MALNATYIFCGGASSCTFSPSINGTDGIWCRGGYSCFGSDIVDSSSTIYCNGLYSCGYISSGLIAPNIQCHGELACSNVNEIDFTGVVYCNSERSCQNTILQAGDSNVDIYFDGHLSGYNSTVYSYGNNGRIDIFFRGSSSGENTKIICGYSDSCYIDCYANSCDNVNGICHNCSNLEFDCTYAHKSSVCPDGVYKTYISCALF